jgi:hypothetical protein
MSLTPAEIQFNTSSVHDPPPGYTAWKISNKYPPPKSTISSTVDALPGLPGQLPNGYGDAPWLEIDFKKDPRYYMDVVKEYCLEGMIECDFAVASNKVISSLFCHKLSELKLHVGKALVPCSMDAL